ncbi:MAG: hypothetical protein WA624_18195, partial [Methylocella sp.]
PQAVAPQGSAAQTTGEAAQTTGEAAEVTTPQSATGPARVQFQNAQKAMQQGNWKKFGTAMEALKRLLANPTM